MNDDNNLFGELLEQGTAQVKQGASDAATQATGQNFAGPSDSAQAQQSDQETKKVIEELYEKSPDKNQNQNQQAPLAHQGAIQNLSSQVLGMEQSPEVTAQLEAVRKQLHDAYFQNTFNKPKQQEESVTEKNEREDQQKSWELQQKQAEAPPPLAVQRAQTHTEMMPGTSG